MPDLPLLLAVVATPVLGFLALRRAGAFVLAEDAALIRLDRRLKRQRRTTVSDRLSRRGFLRPLDDARDLRRLLIISGSHVTPATWGLRVIGGVLAVLAGAVIINTTGLLLSQGVILAWELVVVLMLLVPVAAFLRLRLRALRHRDSAGRALGELAAVLAALGNRSPLRNPSNVEPTDLVAMVSRWIDDPALRLIVEDNNWRRLADGERALPTSEAGWFHLIADLYDIPAAARVGAVVRISREQNTRDVSGRYLLTARDLTRERLANLRARNRRALITQVVPMIGLLAALLILVLSAVAAIHIGAG